MQDLLTNFGIQPILLAAQIVNFLVVLWLLKKFAYKPLFDLLAKRKKLIEEGVKNAQESEEVLKKAEEKEKEIIKKAQQVSQNMLEDAQKQAADTLTHAEESARLRVERMLEDAKLEIERQTKETERHLAAHTAQLAVDMLEKSLQGLVDSKTQKEVVSKTLKKLGN